MTYAEKERRLSELWKVFGLHSQAGKSLHKLFGNQYRKHGENFPQLGTRNFRTNLPKKRKHRDRYSHSVVKENYKRKNRLSRNLFKEQTEDFKDSQAMLNHLENQFAYVARTCKSRRNYVPYINNFKDFRKNLKESKKFIGVSEEKMKKIKKMKLDGKMKKFKIDLVPRKKEKRI